MPTINTNFKTVLPAHFTLKQKGYGRKRYKKMCEKIQITKTLLVQELSLYPSCRFGFLLDTLLLIYTLLTNVNMRSKECSCWNTTWVCMALSATLQIGSCIWLHLHELSRTWLRLPVLFWRSNSRKGQCFLLEEHIQFILTADCYEKNGFVFPPPPSTSQKDIKLDWEKEELKLSMRVNECS